MGLCFFGCLGFGAEDSGGDSKSDCSSFSIELSKLLLSFLAEVKFIFLTLS